jgi:putative Mn2+ efflux pump MntP
VLTLLLVAASLGLSNFTAATGIGVAGVDARTRLRVGLVFVVFEAGMRIVGLRLGHGVAGALGQTTRWLGAGLLGATGAYSLWQSVRGRDGGVPTGLGLGRLIVTGLALSVDNLAVGFALGGVRVPFALAAAVIGAVGILLSLVGLELGARIGTVAGRRGVILVAVGAAIAGGAL